MNVRSGGAYVNARDASYLKARDMPWHGLGRAPLRPLETRRILGGHARRVVHGTRGSALAEKGGGQRAAACRAGGGARRSLFAQYSPKEPAFRARSSIAR